MPMVLDQMGEDIEISRAGELRINSFDNRRFTAVVKVISQEANTTKASTTNGQAMIERAEVLIPVFLDEYFTSYDPTFYDYDRHDEKFTTAHTVKIRGQIFSIESIGTEDGGFRKMICNARNREVTNRSALNGRL